jgi:hypothetical protein
MLDWMDMKEQADTHSSSSISEQRTSRQEQEEQPTSGGCTVSAGTSAASGPAHSSRREGVTKDAAAGPAAADGGGCGGGNEKPHQVQQQQQQEDDQSNKERENLKELPSYDDLVQAILASPETLAYIQDSSCNSSYTQPAALQCFKVRKVHPRQNVCYYIMSAMTHVCDIHAAWFCGSSVLAVAAHGCHLVVAAALEQLKIQSILYLHGWLGLHSSDLPGPTGVQTAPDFVPFHSGRAAASHQ